MKYRHFPELFVQSSNYMRSVHMILQTKLRLPLLSLNSS